METSTIYLIIAVGAMLTGLAGILVPVLPGVPLMFTVALVYGFIDSFTRLSIGELLILLGITFASIVVDYLSGVLGAKFGGASKKALLYGFIGLLVGLVLLPPFGGLLGLFAGILLVELQLRKDTKHAVRAATGGLLGSVIGIGINLVLALLTLGLFIYFVLH